jgi:hypothetical protein
LHRALREAELRIRELEGQIAAYHRATIGTGVAPVIVRQTSSAAPLPDLAAIAREAPIDVDIPAFDGRRRRRRNAILFVLGVLVVFGGLFAMLALSYMPHH